MKLLQQLAEQYAPGQTTVRKEQEASEELKTLYGKRLSNEREYQIASLAAARKYAPAIESRNRRETAGVLQPESTNDFVA